MPLLCPHGSPVAARTSYLNDDQTAPVTAEDYESGYPRVCGHGICGCFGIHVICLFFLGRVWNICDGLNPKYCGAMA